MAGDCCSLGLSSDSESKTLLPEVKPEEMSQALEPFEGATVFVWDKAQAIEFSF